MAVKFSEFTQKSDATASSVTEIVGYLSSGQLNVRVVPSALDTTYTFATTNGASPALTLAGTKTGETIADTLVTLSALNATALTGSGTNAISIDSTAYALSATDNADPAQNTPVVLTGTGGGDSGTDTVNIIGSGTVGVTSSSGTITITGSGGGGVTSFTNTNGTFISAATANSAATGAVTTGIIDLSATGTPDATTFLRGDNQWATPAGSYTDWKLEGDQGAQQAIADGNVTTFKENTTVTVNNVQVGGGVVTTAANTDNLLLDQTSEQVVTVAGSVYVIDGASQPTIVLPRGFTYEFNQDDSSNDSHPFVIGTSAASSPYATGIQYYGSTSANTLTEVDQSVYANTTNFNTYATRRVRIRITQNTPALFYYCSVHGATYGGSIAYGASSGATFTVATTSGTGSNDTLALGVSPGSDDNVQLYIDGVYQSKSAYTVTGSNLVLDGGAKFPNGSAVEATTIT